MTASEHRTTTVLLQLFNENALGDKILHSYFASHRELVDAEQLDSSTVVVSLPIYYSSNHRVEITIRQSPTGDFVLSDTGTTLGELSLAGIPISSHTKKRIVAIAANAKVRFIGDMLVRDCSPEQLGDVLHLFGDSLKTIGDAYLLYRSRADNAEEEIRQKVKSVLVSNSYVFKEKEEIRGEAESHTVDFFVPPNGIPGLALSILVRPTRLTAEAWAFKAIDIKTIHKKLKVGLVYGVDSKNEKPRELINRKIDLAIPSSDLDALANGLVPLFKAKH